MYDHQERTWRHLNFFEHTCYLHASVPRVQTTDGRTVLVSVPWAQPGSSFTLLFEAYAMLFVQQGLSLSAVGRYLKVDSRVIGRIISREVEDALDSQPLEPVTKLGLDETSSRRGHRYLTILTDLDRKKVVGVSLGKDGEAVHKALSAMELRQAKASDVEVVSMDMSVAYIAAVKDLMPKADVVFDRFHIESILHKAVDEVRREEQRHTAQLRKSRYLWLKNNRSLNSNQQDRVHYLSKAFPRIGKAYQLKEQFKEIWNASSFTEGIKTLEAWITLARESMLKPFLEFVKTLENHWYGIREYFQHRVTNGFVENVNLKIQQIKRIARGYANSTNFVNMIYFHLGGLKLSIPTLNS